MATSIIINNQHYVSVSLAARWLGISKARIRAYLEAGELKGYRLSARGWWMIHRDSVYQKRAEIAGCAGDTFKDKEIVRQNGR